MIRRHKAELVKLLTKNHEHFDNFWNLLRKVDKEKITFINKNGGARTSPEAKCEQLLSGILLRSRPVLRYNSRIAQTLDECSRIATEEHRNALHKLCQILKEADDDRDDDIKPLLTSDFMVFISKHFESGSFASDDWRTAIQTEGRFTISQKQDILLHALKVADSKKSYKFLREFIKILLDNREHPINTRGIISNYFKNNFDSYSGAELEMEAILYDSIDEAEELEDQKLAKAEDVLALLMSRVDMREHFQRFTANSVDSQKFKTFLDLISDLDLDIEAKREAINVLQETNNSHLFDALLPGHVQLLLDEKKQKAFKGTEI